jgi:hypothetical protein
MSDSMWTTGRLHVQRRLHLPSWILLKDFIKPYNARLFVSKLPQIKNWLCVEQALAYRIICEMYRLYAGEDCYVGKGVEDGQIEST